MRRSRIALAVTALIALSLTGTSVFAATIEVVQGPISVNRGSGFSRVSGVGQVKAGDTVMASNAGVARVTYGGGCVMEVWAGMTFTVPSDASCNPQAAQPRPTKY